MVDLQPMETAPRDGTRILVLFADGKLAKEPTVYIADYVDMKTLNHGRVESVYQRWHLEGWGGMYDADEGHFLGWALLPELAEVAAE